MFLDLETVTWHTYASTTTDAHGNDVPAFTDSTLQLSLWPTVATETGLSVAIDGLSGLAMGRLDVGSLDECTARGVRYRMQADALFYHSPLTGAEVTQVNLLRRS